MYGFGGKNRYKMTLILLIETLSNVCMWLVDNKTLNPSIRYQFMPQKS